MRRFIASVIVSVCVAGCVSDGGIGSRNPFQTEPAAPASAGYRPIRQAQIPLDGLLWSVVCNEFTGAERPKTCAEQSSVGAEKLTRLMAGVAQTPSADRARIRNEIVGQLFFSSTANCNVYLQSVRSGQVATRTGSDIVSSLMGFLGSIAKTESDASMFAGLSGLSTSLGASADRNIFAEVGVELIADEIYKIRANQRALIEAKLALPYASWPIGLAMTDIYEFHGSCSLLKGLSAMRTAVATRDAAVKAARGAAVEAARAGGDGNTVAAAVVGVEQAFSANRSPDRVASASVSSGLGNADLEVMRGAAMSCLDAARNRATADLAAPVSDLLGKVATVCKPLTVASPEWALRYVAIVREEIDGASQALDEAREAQRLYEAGVSARSNESQARGQAQAARDAVTAAPADEAAKEKLTKATEAEEIAMQARQIAEDAAVAAAKKLPTGHHADKALGEAFSAVEATVKRRIVADMSYVEGVRAAVVRYGLTAGEQGATAAQVVQGQSATAGVLADGDPVIVAMIAAARTVAENPGLAQNGLMAARAAQAQAQVLSNYAGP